MSTTTTTYAEVTDSRRVAVREVRQNATCRCGQSHTRVVDRSTTEVRQYSRVYGWKSWQPRSVSYSVDSVRLSDLPAPACGCGRPLDYRDVRGVRTTTPCDAACLNATGHDCQCSCGGKNHGAGHAR